MLTILEPARSLARLEALSHPPRRHHRTRSSLDERPARDARRPGEPRDLSGEKRSQLPSDLKGLRVLVVDDDEETVELFAAVLATCGADVATATSAPEGLRLLASRPADVVLSDIAMPDADGYWFVREIRRQADARVRSVPVVAATAYGLEHPRSRALAAGFAEHLQKPVDPEVLCRTVAKAAGR